MRRGVTFGVTAYLIWGLFPLYFPLVLAGAALIGVNWVIYIWAVNNDRVVDAALGYFINPLVTVLFGVLIFKERLRVGQWVAVGLGAVAVTVLAVVGGTVPWIALSLASSFACYGLVKKVVPRWAT